MDHQQWLEQHDRMIANMDRLLGRAVSEGLREARNERRKRHELDDRITPLAAVQLVTEEKVQAAEDQIRTTAEEMKALFRKKDSFQEGFRGGNGHS